MKNLKLNPRSKKLFFNLFWNFIRQTPPPANPLTGGQRPPSVKTRVRFELRFHAVLQRWGSVTPSVRGVTDPLSGWNIVLVGVGDTADGVTDPLGRSNGYFYCPIKLAFESLIFLHFCFYINVHYT